CAINWGAMDYW
nr:immunoglobulin heavy chain junction region [Mus musculus]